MSEQQIKQRIQYLVEHGGLYPAEESDAKRVLRHNRVMLGCIFALLVLEVVAHVCCR